MDNLQNVKELIGTIGGSDGPTAVFVAGKLGKLGMGVTIASVIMGVLFCFLGFKLIKVISALMGLGIGVAAGAVISSIAGIDGITRIIIIFASAVFLAALLFFLHRVGIFLMVFITVVSGMLVFVGTGEKTYVIAALGAAVVLGIIAMIFSEPGAIIITALTGGASAGTGIASLAGLTDNKFIGLGIAGGLAVFGIVVQFLLHSKKAGKKEKELKGKTKKKDSMESEVEKARMLLDDEEEE